MFSFRFLVCNFVIVLLLGLILALKSILKKHITLRSQYYLWYVFIFALIIPFVPNNNWVPSQLMTRLESFLHQESTKILNNTKEQIENSNFNLHLGESDFATSTADLPYIRLSNLFLIIWMIGCVVTMIYFVCNIIKVNYIKRAAYLITAENEPDLYEQYISCMMELNIKHNVALYASCNVLSPISYGLIYPKIVIPQDMDIVLSKKDLRFIFLHELQHYKHKDSLLNYISCILQVIYWFNPFIWYGFKILRKDREIACDNSVIHIIGQEQSINYGYTLIKYADKIRHNTLLSPLSSLGDEKKVIMQRIREIANYQIITQKQKIKSLVLLLFTCLVVYSISPLLTVYASHNSTYDFSSQQVKEVDLSSHFTSMDGSFVLYDIATEQYQIFNSDLSIKRISPDSTFKIFSGLFALQEGIITPNHSNQQWDGTNYFFDSWNQDQTLTSAMQNSVNWYFQQLDNLIGYPKLYSYYQKISYGNCDLSSGLDNYWAESSLKISPVEQVILLSELLTNKWNFDSENIKAIKNSLFIANTSIGKLYGKTGTGANEGKNVNGWFIGFIEQDNKTYCFATNIQDSNNATGSKASEITLQILDTLLS